MYVFFSFCFFVDSHSGNIANHVPFLNDFKDYQLLQNLNVKLPTISIYKKNKNIGFIE